MTKNIKNTHKEENKIKRKENRNKRRKRKFADANEASVPDIERAEDLKNRTEMRLFDSDLLINSYQKGLTYKQHVSR